MDKFKFIDPESQMISKSCVEDTIKVVANRFYTNYYNVKYGLTASLTCDEYDHARIQGIENFEKALIDQFFQLFDNARLAEIKAENYEK